MIRYIIILFLSAGALSAQTTSGFIGQSETWDQDSVLLTGSVTVAAGTLTVMPGTVVRGLVTNFTITGPGVIRAVGTADNRVEFTGIKFIMEALTNDSLCLFKNCLFRNNYCLIEFRNPSGVTETSRLVIDSCEFSNGGYTSLYVTSGGEPRISNCSFHDAATGIFLHGGGDISVTHTYIYNVSCGIINATHPDWHQDLTVDHVTIHNVDTSRSYDWAKGLGITNGNEPGSIILTNSIISTTWKYGFQTGRDGWTITEANNCFYDNRWGASSDTLSGSTLEADPRFVQPASDDFRLYDDSPCRGAASDGTNIGAWQGAAVGLSDRAHKNSGGFVLHRHPAEKKLLCTSPGADFITLSIADPGGGVRYSATGQGSLTWCYAGNPPGVYLVKLTLEGNTYIQSVLIF